MALGFAPLFAVMTGAENTTDALTSIFTFITGLRAAKPGSLAAITTLLTGEDISGTGDFGAGETNGDAGDPQECCRSSDIMLNVREDRLQPFAFR